MAGLYQNAKEIAKLPFNPLRSPAFLIFFDHKLPTYCKKLYLCTQKIEKVSSHRRKSPKSKSRSTCRNPYTWAAVLRWIQVFGDTSSCGAGSSSFFL